MNMNDEKLDYLFNQARSQEPVASLEETKKAFVMATVTAAGGVLATKGLLKLLTAKKWIIMLSTVTIITTGSIIVGLSSNPKEPEMEKPVPSETIVTTVDDREPLLTDLSNDSGSVELVEPYAELEGAEIARPEKEDLFELIGNEPDFFEENDFKFEADTNGIAFVSQRPPKKLDQLARTQEEIRSYDQRFQITEKTTVEDLENIKKSAEASGIDFDYKAKYNKDKLTKLRLEIKTEDKSGDGHDSQFIMTNLNIQGEFDYTIAWDQNEDGSVEHVYCGHTDEFDDDIEGALEDAMDELESILDDIDLTALMIEMDSLGDIIARDFEIEWEELEEELAEHQEEIQEAFEEFDREDMEAVILEITESSAELIRLLNVELEEIQKSLEKEMEELEKQQQEQEEGDEEESDAEEVEEGEDDERRQNITRPFHRSKIKSKKHQQLKDELIADGIIAANALKLSVYATYKSIKIDGKEIPEEFYEKYEALILELFDIDITNKSTSWSWVSNHTRD